MLPIVNASSPLADRKVDACQKVAQKLLDIGIANAVAYSSLMRMVWNPGNGLTPQDVVDEMGTDAAAVFAGAAEWGNLIANSLAKSGVPQQKIASLLMPKPANVTVTPHADGTVTLTTV